MNCILRMRILPNALYGWLSVPRFMLTIKICFFSTISSNVTRFSHEPVIRANESPTNGIMLFSRPRIFVSQSLSS